MCKYKYKVVQFIRRLFILPLHPNLKTIIT